MGWTSFRLNEPIKVWFKNQWESSNKYIVLDSGLVHFTTLYGAIKDIETGDVFCAVFLITWSKGYYNFSYKDMTEYVGPCQYDCPKKVYDLLTPLVNDTNGWAYNWRKKVEERLALKKKK